ncbi:putative bifunctional diguanylate cyclase/phosphodiesterase [Paraferrimonas haliotis]|uniref:PAS domain S-box-containing protein/diguanylate cyclase (GGDEF) domain-containing protein n=1 Tax=Paraferrimonas haliotis TaxID=2013866 RepID=A0AA37TM53_9GAMM|nr:EAL domain-containing protein [Paraferrimonas haliotis]GLS82058.1 hypothetical protein GCM10007894_00350 [Paraferrimonas haliotis]
MSGKYNLRNGLVSLLLICLVVLLVVDHVYEKEQAKNFYISQQQQMLERYIHGYTEELRSAFSEMDEQRIRWVIEAVAQEKDVRQVLVINDNGMVSYGNRAIWEGNQVELIAPAFQPKNQYFAYQQIGFLSSFNDKRNSLQVYYPLTPLTDKQGPILFVEYDFSAAMDSVAANAWQRLLRLSVIGVLLIALVAFVATLLVSRPLSMIDRFLQTRSHAELKPRRWWAVDLQKLAALLNRQKRHLSLLQKEVDDQQDRWQYLLDAGELALIDWRLGSNDMVLSPGCYEMLGVGELELLPQISSFKQRLHPQDIETFEAGLLELKNVEQDQHQLHYRLKHKHGHWLPILQRSLVVERTGAGEAKRVLAIIADLSHTNKLKQALAHQARHDGLTNLSNRSAFLADLTAQCRSLQQPQQRLALMLLDIDNFKAWNDALGHVQADELLLRVTARLSGHFPQYQVGRLSGNEFGILVDDLDSASNIDHRLAGLAEQVRQLLADEYEYGAFELHLTVSIGVSVIQGNHGLVMSEWLRQTEVALRYSQQQGGDQYTVFSDQLEQTQQHQQWLLSQLRVALRRNQLSVYYQPIYNRHRQLVAVEALVRWQHPEIGDISPAQFIPVAEQSGLINDLGEFVVERSCKMLSLLAEQGIRQPLVSINVGAKQLDMDEFSQRMLSQLQHHQVDPSLIQLELTEYVLLQESQSLQPRLKALVDAGISIAVDDFGTGYSALSYLTELPIDKLKIDGSFVQQLEGNSKAEALLKSVIELGHNLSLEVVAEGVSNDAQLRLLTQLNCDYYQGFWLQKPLPKVDLMLVLKREQVPAQSER